MLNEGHSQRVLTVLIGTRKGDLQEIMIPRKHWTDFARLVARLSGLPEGFHTLRDYVDLGFEAKDILFSKDMVFVETDNEDWNEFFANRSNRRH